MVIVQKRINTRFFLATGRNATNPGPGTIVDSTVTRPESYDFFIVSQSVRQGTVTPAHYNVVWDECGLKVDHMQRLTYKLCHLYYNWPVSYCYYWSLYVKYRKKVIVCCSGLMYFLLL